jgi:hypothetical protein
MRMSEGLEMGAVGSLGKGDLEGNVIDCLARRSEGLASHKHDGSGGGDFEIGREAFRESLEFFLQVQRGLGLRFEDLQLRTTGLRAGDGKPGMDLILGRSRIAA